VFATPSLPVAIDRPVSLPKSCVTPFTIISTRIDTPATGAPFGPLAVTLIAAWDAPSWLRESGVACTVSDSASSDGPVNGGVSDW
jgi:hypothetical protein